MFSLLEIVLYGAVLVALCVPFAIYEVRRSER